MILTTILSFAFATYNNNMTEISQYIEGNADVNENLQRVILMYGRVISFQEYRNDKAIVIHLLRQTMGDLYDFYDETRS